MKTIQIKSAEPSDLISASSSTLDPCVMVVFGASGDLTRRKLVPALYQLARDGQLPECFRMLGFARSPTEIDAFRRELHESAAQFARKRPIDESAWRSFSECIEYHQGDYDDPDAYKALAERLRAMNMSCDVGGNGLFYLDLRSLQIQKC